MGESIWIAKARGGSADVLKLHAAAGAEGSRAVPGQPFAWPFIDIVVAREDKTSGGGGGGGGGKGGDLRVLDRRHPRSILQHRSRAIFGGVSVWAPR